MSRPPCKAVIFDLDGVLADTAQAHFQAWRRFADELDLPFDEKINERLKGVPREACLEILLEGAARPWSRDEKQRFLERKNRYYRALVAKLAPESALLPGARAALEGCRAAGLKTALASASRNAGEVIGRLGLDPLLDYVADAAAIARPKPAPDIFLDAARGVGAPARQCIGIEDAAAGIQAIRAAGMYAIGIGETAALEGAHEVIASLADFEVPATAGFRIGG